jgi:hypothetical protein
MKKPFYRLFLLLFSTLIIQQIASAQKTNCTDWKKGNFFSYPKNTNESWKSEREGNLQKEINLSTGDTSTWKITWQNECQYTLKFISGGNFKKEELTFLKQNNLVFVITKSSEDYYVFNQYTDKVSKNPVFIDTIWKDERTSIKDKRFFSQIKPEDVRKMRFKDTSGYALLYVYRPGKFICSQIALSLNSNNVFMADVHNNSSYVFKILKEGPLYLTAGTANHKFKQSVDIEFGKKYYIMCDTKWTADRCKPLLFEEDKKVGELGFLGTL